ncbi:MAG: GreA/GreB family elongation factor [Candidatus Methylomirabilales bacterium]
MSFQDLLKSLREEVAVLERELKVELPKKIEAARALGDISENAEFDAAKNRQGFVSARIQFLQQRIAALSSVDLTHIPRDRVGFGSTVTLRDLESDKERIIRLVTPEEANGQRGWVSAASPVGRALIGKRAGDEVTIQAPGGTRTYTIERLVTLPDAPPDGAD